MTETMRWYNPVRRVEEEVPAPMSDAQAIELLSGHPDSDEFIEETGDGARGKRML